MKRGKAKAPAKPYSVAGHFTTALSAKQNYIFIASADELYINSSLRELSKLSRNNDIILLGMEFITSMESIPLDYFENLQLEFATSYWVDQNTARVRDFNTGFTEKYRIRPSGFAYRGYDLTLYFGSMLFTYGPGLGFDQDVYNPVRFKMLYPYYFETSGADGRTDYLENKHVTILQYRNFRFVKVG
ncbi:MAG: hypothetical protein R2794_11455 [Chitinophagales bacterium]